MKGFKHKPPEQKAQSINWTQIVIIVICVVMAVGMVVSMFGTSWLNFFTKIKEGDSVVIDFTVYDKLGRPVVTSSQSIYQKTEEKNDVIFFTGRMPVIAGAVTNRDIVPIEVFSQYTTSGLMEFGLFGPEIDEMTYAVIGQKVGSSLTVNIPMSADLVRTMDHEQFIQIAGDILDIIQVGDQLPISFSETPQIALDNSTPLTYLRTATIAEIADTEITLNYGYPSIAVTVAELRRAS
jgi:hypothetical protein